MMPCTISNAEAVRQHECDTEMARGNAFGVLPAEDDAASVPQWGARGVHLVLGL